MKEIVEVGHSVGARVGFDLAHAAGNIILELHDWNVDFAAWCTYKYLNSGAGAIGGGFIHENHFDTDLPRYAGWWGHDTSTRFKMAPNFVPIPGPMGYRVSNTSPLMVCSVESSLQIYDQITMKDFRTKSVKLTNYLEDLIVENLSDKVEVITPKGDSRGCQLSIRFVIDLDISSLEENLFSKGVAIDVRGAVIRVAPQPLYNTFQEVKDFVEILNECLIQ
eukprot:TRINITY_DN5980_c0_g1_i2.p1 TRINITY_DN5980_c0_g1~~TRINITY_DN5980_c0_g1_i2.p1  ORF type:complete len:221 (+),score=52.15 TRINITY_DN5980_c0_g1_i2:242-904(+)